MGVPFEALIPYAIMLGVRSLRAFSIKTQTDTMPQMFGATGAGLSKIRHMQNGGKRARHSIDQWDKQSIDTARKKRHQLLTLWAVMDRDRRLTGFLRGQTDNVQAPPGFELNNPWRVSYPFPMTESSILIDWKQTERSIY